MSSTLPGTGNSAVYGSKKKRLYMTDESAYPIMVNVDDLKKVKHCGPKRAMYIYERLPLIRYNPYGFLDVGLEEDSRLMKSYSWNIICEIVQSHNRDLYEFSIQSVIGKHIEQKDHVWERYLDMKRNTGAPREQIMQDLYDWWLQKLMTKAEEFYE